MRALSAEAVLDFWSAGSEAGASRALALLVAGADGESPEELAALPLGERNRRLLALRQATLGRSLELCAACPACRQELEASIEAADLPLAETPAGSSRSLGELEVEVTPVTGDDLRAAATAADPEAATLVLARRCVTTLVRTGKPVAVEDLTSEELAAVAAALAEADPGAEILLNLACDACGHGWTEELDVAAFFIAELDQVAAALVAEVHLLARAYGWREREILALPARRRARYLERVAEEGLA